jgi:hypothetical protein
MFEWLFSKLTTEIVLCWLVVPVGISIILAASAGALGLSVGAILGPIFAGLSAGIAIILGVMGFIWGVNRYAHRAFPLRILMGIFHWMIGFPLAIWLTGRSIMEIGSGITRFSNFPWGFPGVEDPEIQAAAHAVNDSSGPLEIIQLLWRRARAVTDPDEETRLQRLQEVQGELERAGVIMSDAGKLKR